MIVTPKALESRWVPYEVAQLTGCCTVDHELPVIPLYLDQAHPAQLRAHDEPSLHGLAERGGFLEPAKMVDVVMARLEPMLARAADLAQLGIVYEGLCSVLSQLTEYDVGIALRQLRPDEPSYRPADEVKRP